MLAEQSSLVLALACGAIVYFGGDLKAVGRTNRVRLLVLLFSPKISGEIAKSAEKMNSPHISSSLVLSSQFFLLVVGHKIGTLEHSPRLPGNAATLLVDKLPACGHCSDPSVKQDQFETPVLHKTPSEVNT